MNKLSKTNRVLWVFQLDIHGGRAPNPTRAGRYKNSSKLKSIGLVEIEIEIEAKSMIETKMS